MERTPQGTRPVPDVPGIGKVGMGIAALVCLYASLTSSAAWGPGVRNAAGGVFGASGTPLAPAEPAFGIWAIIYVGLFGLSVRVWLPDARAHARRRLVMWPGGMSMLLNALWLLCALRGMVWVTLPVMLGVVWAVISTLEGGRRIPAHDATALLLVDGTFGLYLGWLLVAAPANAASVLVAAGLPRDGATVVAASVLLLVCSTGAALWAMRRYRGNWGIPLALCWGLVWLVRARTHGGPDAPAVVGVAVVAAATVMASFLLQIGTSPAGRRGRRLADVLARERS